MRHLGSTARTTRKRPGLERSGRFCVGSHRPNVSARYRSCSDETSEVPERKRPAASITAATRNAACAVGLGKETGSLEVGKWADAIVLDVDDYRHLGYRFGSNLVQTVIKRGKVVVGG